MVYPPKPASLTRFPDSQRATNTFSKPTYSKEVANAIEEICKKLNLLEFDSIYTKTMAPNHRRLCLYTCDFGHPYERLKIIVESLVSEGMHTKAATLAIMHNQGKLALQALRDGNVSSAHRELSMALAVYNKGLADDESWWDETIRDLLAKFDDPFARALVSLVRSGDWNDMLTETSLPLRWRVGIALMRLDDQELDKYIDSQLAECVECGDLEGIVLTGLTERAVPLFATYIRRFQDLQTAVLAMCQACPRYFIDPRVDLWRETYRSNLNTWNMFQYRGRFDAQSARFSFSPEDNSNLSLPVRQITLQCNYCDKRLDHSSRHVPAPTASNNSKIHSQKIFDLAGTVCPSCSHHLPRCSYCEEWLGMPNVGSRVGLANANNNKDIMEKYSVECQACSHVLHGNHATEWFANHTVCPAEECDCRCAEIDSGRSIAAVS